MSLFKKNIILRYPFYQFCLSFVVLCWTWVLLLALGELGLGGTAAVFGRPAHRASFPLWSDVSCRGRRCKDRLRCQSCQRLSEADMMSLVSADCLESREQCWGRNTDGWKTWILMTSARNTKDTPHPQHSNPPGRGHPQWRSYILGYLSFLQIKKWIKWYPNVGIKCQKLVHANHTQSKTLTNFSTFWSNFLKCCVLFLVFTVLTSSLSYIFQK